MTEPRPGKPIVDKNLAHVFAIDENLSKSPAVLVLADPEYLNSLAVRQLGESAFSLLRHLDLIGTLPLISAVSRPGTRSRSEPCIMMTRKLSRSQTRNCCGQHVAAQRYAAITMWLLILD